MLLKNIFGVSLVPSITQKVLLRCIDKSPNTTEQNVKALFSVLELANNSMSINDKI